MVGSQVVGWNVVEGDADGVVGGTTEGEAEGAVDGTDEGRKESEGDADEVVEGATEGEGDVGVPDGAADGDEEVVSGSIAIGRSVLCFFFFFILFFILFIMLFFILFIMLFFILLFPVFIVGAGVGASKGPIGDGVFIIILLLFIIKRL